VGSLVGPRGGKAEGLAGPSVGVAGRRPGARRRWGSGVGAGVRGRRWWVTRARISLARLAAGAWGGGGAPPVGGLGASRWWSGDGGGGGH